MRILLLPYIEQQSLYDNITSYSSGTSISQDFQTYWTTLIPILITLDNSFFVF
ncbi:MAG: DUF1559 domain-containing protein [Planctomycetaceae bacterium]|nr:DUF1559 domain-containing protein [Planctomycetaceae bacterium]